MIKSSLPDSAGNPIFPFVHRLPYELLAHVFVIGHQTVKDSYNSQALLAYLHCITAVCSRWRQIALSHSNLWATVRLIKEPKSGPLLDHETLEIFQSQLRQVLKVFGARGSHVPLDVFIDLDGTSPGILGWIIGQLHQYWGQCRSLSLVFATPWEALEILSILSLYPLPDLRDFELSIMRQTGRGAGEPLLRAVSSLDTAQIRSLGIFGFTRFPFDRISGEALQCLRFDLIPHEVAEQTIRFLQSTPNLKKLDISIRSSYPLNLSLSPQLYLPSLENLTIHDISHLPFALNLSETEGAEILDSLVQTIRSNPLEPNLELPSLREMVIRSTAKLDPWTIRDMLDQFLSLQTLEVHCCSYLSHVLLPLMPNPEQRRWPTMHMREDADHEGLTVIPQLKLLRLRDSVDLVESAPPGTALSNIFHDMMKFRPALKIECDTHSFSGSRGALQDLKSSHDERVEVIVFAMDV